MAHKNHRSKLVVQISIDVLIIGKVENILNWRHLNRWNTNCKWSSSKHKAPCSLSILSLDLPHLTSSVMTSLPVCRQCPHADHVIWTVLTWYWQDSFVYCFFGVCFFFNDTFVVESIRFFIIIKKGSHGHFRSPSNLPTPIRYTVYLINKYDSHSMSRIRNRTNRSKIENIITKSLV